MYGVDVWQKPIQYCKAIILQFKINKFTKKKKKDEPKLVSEVQVICSS